MRIRAYCPRDLSCITKLFRETVHHIGAGHYSREELDAWAPADLRPADWQPRLARNAGLIAEDRAKIVGFAELSPDSFIDMIYVHKDHQCQGIATALLAALEAKARMDGLERLETNASRMAKPFFARRGFRLLTAQMVERSGVRIENFRMEKTITPQRSRNEEG